MCVCVYVILQHLLHKRLHNKRTEGDLHTNRTDSCARVDSTSTSVTCLYNFQNLPTTFSSNTHACDHLTRSCTTETCINLMLLYEQQQQQPSFGMHTLLLLYILCILFVLHPTLLLLLLWHRRECVLSSDTLVR